MKILAARAVILTAIIFQLSACGSSPVLPVLEGGHMQIDDNRNAEAKPALVELSRIDLVYELDPKNYGSCHPGVDADDAPPANPAKELTSAAKLKCALDGFYHYQYYLDLPDIQRQSLKVNNVAFAYIAKQADRLKELAQDFDQAKVKYRFQY